MTITYFEVTAEIEGEREVIFGSYIQSECQYELDSERDTLKGQGYKKIKIVERQVAEEPDPTVYEGQIVTSNELWLREAPSFNFELNETELLAKALERDFVTKINGAEDQYLINDEYEPETYKG